VLAALASGFGTRTKADRSLVTDVDRAVERRLRDLIDGWFPDHGVLGEEYAPSRPESPFQWVMDPLDGTEELVHGIPTYGTMLALFWRGRPLVGVIDHPPLDVRVHAGVGLGAYRNGVRIRLGEAPRPERPG
jgi:fructose-1,6-bisphosphatase/inositol monophosphatase family enzyme